MNMKRLLLIASLAFITLSCKNDKIEIDSSSAQTFSETVDEISKSLPVYIPITLAILLILVVVDSYSLCTTA